MSMFRKPYIKLTEANYFNLIIFIAPAMNFLAGFALELYAPSMPSIAKEFHTSQMLLENTIAITVLGYAIGGSLLGLFFDFFGRKPIIIVALIIFISVSLLAPEINNINQLLIIRFIQGLTTAALAIGSRVIPMDHFKDNPSRFTVAILYSSFAYGIGVIISPYLGGYLEEIFGWHANFYAFSLVAILLLLPIIIFVEERFDASSSKDISIIQTIQIYKKILSNRFFLLGVLILGSTQLELMFYPTIGPFIIEHELGQSAVIYGKTSLIVGVGYLIGVITNRYFLNKIGQRRLMPVGICFKILALTILIIESIFFRINLYGLVIAVFIISYANGFLVGNTYSKTINLFKQNTGILVSVQAFSIMMIASLFSFVSSMFHLRSFSQIMIYFLLIILVQIITYSKFRRIFDLNL